MGGRQDPFEIGKAIDQARKDAKQARRLHREDELRAAEARQAEERARRPVRGKLYDSLIGPFLRIMAANGNPGCIAFTSVEPIRRRPGLSLFRKEVRFTRQKFKNHKGWEIGDDKTGFSISVPGEGGRGQSSYVIYLTPDGRTWHGKPATYSIRPMELSESHVEEYHIPEMMGRILFENGLTWH